MSTRFSSEVPMGTKINSVCYLERFLGSMSRSKRTKEEWRSDLGFGAQALRGWEKALRWRWDVVSLESFLDDNPQKTISGVDIFEGQAAAEPSIMLFRTAELPLAEAVLKRVNALPRWASVDLLKDTKYWQMTNSDGISKLLKTRYAGLSLQLGEVQTGDQTTYQLDAVLSQEYAAANQRMISVA